MNIKRLSIALVVFTGSILAYTLWANYAKQAHEPALPQSPATQPAPQATHSPAPATQPAGTVTTAASALTGQDQYFVASFSGPAQSTTLGALDGEGTDYVFQLDLTSQGAAIDALKLARYFASVADQQAHARDPKAYAAALQAGGKYRGHYSLLNPVRQGGTTYLPLATRAVTVRLEGESQPRRLSLEGRNWHRLETPATAPADGQAVSFALEAYRGVSSESAQSNPVLRVVKTYSIRPGDYSVRVTLTVENLLKDRKIYVGLDQLGPAGIPREDPREDLRRGAYGKTKENDPNATQVLLKDRKELDSAKLGEPIWLGRSDDSQAMLWAGGTNKFFASMFYVMPPGGSDALAAPSEHAGFYLLPAAESDSSRTFVSGVTFDETELAPGQSRAVTLDLFAGPKKREIFADAASPFHHAIYDRLNYISTIDLKGCFCSFDWLALGMMKLLGMLSVASLGNYGVAIILLVVLVRLLLHPLTKRGQINMMKMQKLGPAMAKIKEKYKDDKNAMNQEMMRFYKQQGATPLLGCLPMFLQMPIWIALYTGLNASVELRHAAFLPFWLTDLAAPDVIFSWSTPLPLLGITSLHLLPVLLTIAMFLQTKLNPQAMGQTAAMTPEQEQQQKMMKWMMPGMMLFIFYSMPSGLNLYIMTSTFAGVAEQYVIRRHIQKREALEAATETRVEVPGKGVRAARPKKPKGPFWTKRG